MGGGGAARTILNIINYINKEKFEPILVTLDFTYDYESYVHKDVRFMKLNTKRLRSSIVPLAKLIRKERPHILFSTVPTYNIIATLAKMLSFTRTKLIVREAAFLGGTKKENFKLNIYGFFYRFAHQVIALSEGVKENVMKRYHVPSNKIQVIYNPVDVQHIRQEMKKELTSDIQKIFEKEKKVIVTAGRLVKEKDHTSLLHAFAFVNEKIDSELIILGEGELEQSLKDETKRLQIENSVYFVGFQQNPYAIFNRANLFVLTSLTEGFGHVLVEAMATGTPVVSTNCKPGAQEVLDKGKYGLISKVGDVEDIADKMLTVLTMPKEKQNKLINNGIKRAEHFNAKEIVKQYETTFMAIINHK